MKDWIKEKLDIIDYLFPPERVESSKKRLQAVWNGVLPEDRIPYVVYPRYLNYYGDYNGVKEAEQRLRMLLDECILHGYLNDDFIPSLFPGCKQSTIPNMFGAKEIIKGNDYTCERIIKNIEDIDKLPAHSMAAGTVAYEWLQRQQAWLEETQGRIPIHVTDMQGPVDVCGQLWGYEDLFITAYTKPDIVHKLFYRVSQAFVDFWNRQKSLLGTLFIGTHLWGYSWVPTGNGITISADSIVMVSSDFFEKFFKPPLMEIAEQSKGIVIHSCGQFPHIVKYLHDIPYLKGINASEMSLKQLHENGMSNKTVAIIISEYDTVFDQIQIIKHTRQLVDLTVHLYPQELAEQKPPQDWSKGDWAIIKEREQKLTEALRL